LRSQVKKTCYCYILVQMDEIMINTDETTYYRVGTCHVISVFHIIENY